MAYQDNVLGRLVTIVLLSGVLAGTIAFELLQPITGRDAKILELRGGID